MKYTIFILTFLITSYLYAQKLYVPSVVAEHHEVEWYEEQLKIWTKKTETNPKNEEAWLNKYVAARGIVLKSKYSSQEANKVLNGILKDIYKNVPNTFLYYFMKGREAGVWQEESLDYFEKAYSMNPEFIPLYQELIVNYEVWGEGSQSRKAMNEKWYNSNTYSPGVLNYGYNLLVSLDKGAVLITNGDNDTFPLWMLQDTKSIREDVTVVNSFLICTPKYCEEIFARLNIPYTKELDKLLTAEVGAIYSEKRYQVMEKIMQEILNQKEHRVYVNSSKEPYLKSFAKNLYLVGLVSVYSEEPVERLTYIQRSYEQEYKLNYLTDEFYAEPSPKIVHLTNQCYIPSLVLLYNHYKINHDQKKLDDTRVLIKSLAKGRWNEAKILSLIQ